jgi:hypothetical protein
MAKAKLEIAPEEIKFLREAVEAGERGSFLYSDPLDRVALLDAKLVEVNAQLVDEKGRIATRATKKAAEFLADIPLVEAPPLPDEVIEAAIIEVLPASALESPPPYQYELVSNLPVPEKTRGKVRPSKWPFAQMEVGQSFFIPNGDEYEAAKKYASLVSSAATRYSEVIPGKTRISRKGVAVPKRRKVRVFVMRAVTGDAWGQPGVKGAGVWRTK